MAPKRRALPADPRLTPWPLSTWAEDREPIAYRTRAQRRKGQHTGLLDLPEPILCEIARIVELSWLGWPFPNPLFKIRGASRRLCSVADSSTTSVVFDLSQPRFGRVAEDDSCVLPRVSRFFLRSLPRWPGLTLLVLRLNCAAEHVQEALNLLGNSNCGSLEELCLEAEFFTLDALPPEDLKGDLSLAPLHALPSLRSLTVKDVSLYGEWWAGLSTLTSVRTLVVLSRSSMETLQVPPGLTTLTLDNTELCYMGDPFVQPLRLQACCQLESLTVVRASLSDVLLPASLREIEFRSVDVRPNARCLLNLPGLTCLKFDWVVAQAPLNLILPSALTTLQLSGVGPILAAPVSDWTPFRMLKYLSLCKGHGQVPDSSLFPLLEGLELEAIDDLPHLISPTLKSLTISRCTSWEHSQFSLPLLTHLELLDVRFEPPRDIPWPTGLRHLALSNPELCLAQPFAWHTYPPTLEHLSLSATQVDLQGLGDLPRLSCLKLLSVASLAAISSTSLKYLEFKSCLLGPGLPPLDGLPNLSTLKLSQLSNVTTLPPLAGLTALTSLEVLFVQKLVEVPPINSTKLKMVDLAFCSLVSSLSLPDICPRPRVYIDGDAAIKWVSTTCS